MFWERGKDLKDKKSRIFEANVNANAAMPRPGVIESIELIETIEQKYYRFDRFDILFDSIDMASEGRGVLPCKINCF